MPNLAIAARRLHNQRISTPTFTAPEDVVQWLGAVQAQEYGPTLWSLGQRMTAANEAMIAAAVDEGRILRTHLLRPTWHFVTPADIRWMLALTAPRVHALNAYYNRQLGLEEAIFTRSNAVIAKALEGGHHLTRAELGAALARVGIVADGMRLGYLVQRAELDALICSGARRGKQFTYALLDERAPQTKPLTREEALAELTKRYFTSHGPATLKDFTWWSSLTVADAKAGVELAGDQLIAEVVDEQTVWFAPETVSSQWPTTHPDRHQAYCLSIFDEYISYANRSAIFDPQYAIHYDPKQRPVHPHMIVIDGEILGTWGRSYKKGKAMIQRNLFRPLSEGEEMAVQVATKQFGDFMGLSIVLA